MVFSGTKMGSAALLVGVSLLFFTVGSIRSSAAGAQSRQASRSRKQVKTVVIKDMAYQPSTITVKAGQTVEWKNEDIVPHTATAEAAKGAPGFDSGTIAPGASWRFVPKTKGSFDYLCTFHPNMKAKLVVE